MATMSSCATCDPMEKSVGQESSSICPTSWPKIMSLSSKLAKLNGRSATAFTFLDCSTNERKPLNPCNTGTAMPENVNDVPGLLCKPCPACTTAFRSNLLPSPAAPQWQ